MHTLALYGRDNIKALCEVMKWIITVLGMSIFLLLPSVAVSGTLNISRVSHRIIKITDKKVLLSLLLANTKLFLSVPFLTLSAVYFYITQMFWHLLLPVMIYSISYLITYSAKLEFFLENKSNISTKQKNPNPKTSYQNPLMTYCHEFPLVILFHFGTIRKIFFENSINYLLPCFS